MCLLAEPCLPKGGVDFLRSHFPIKPRLLNGCLEKVLTVHLHVAHGFEEQFCFYFGRNPLFCHVLEDIVVFYRRSVVRLSCEHAGGVPAGAAAQVDGEVPLAVIKPCFPNSPSIKAFFFFFPVFVIRNLL